jgi:hypothetical protein
MKNIINRTWISPVTSISFAVVAVTGIFLALHIKNGSIKMLHEWLGYLFVLIGLLHLIINGKTFIAHFQKPAARIAATACVILVAVMTFSGGTSKSQASQHPAIRLLDKNVDGVIDSQEIQTAVTVLNRLDRERNGSVSPEELLATLSPKSPKK